MYTGLSSGAEIMGQDEAKKYELGRVGQAAGIASALALVSARQNWLEGGRGHLCCTGLAGGNYSCLGINFPAYCQRLCNSSHKGPSPKQVSRRTEMPRQAACIGHSENPQTQERRVKGTGGRVCTNARC